MPAASNWKKNAALFMVGQGITLFGSMLVHYAVMWHITLESQSGWMMTLISIAGALPMFIISPFAGVWADRYNKKLIINIADGAIAVVTLLMAFAFSLGYGRIELLLVCMVVRSLGQGVQVPAVNALIPALVPQEHLIRANGINGSIQSIVMFASPMVGAALLMVAPIQSLLFLDVITAAIGIGILLFFVHLPAREEDASSAAAVQSKVPRYFQEIGAGLRYVGTQPFVKKFLVLAAVFNILVAPAAVLTPLQIARDWGSAVWSLPGGVAFGAEQRLAAAEIAFFVGMMLGGVIMGAWGGFKKKNRTMALSNCLFGLGAIGLGLMTNFWLYLVCMGVSGLVMSLFQAPMMAMLQTHVDAAFMGRVFSVLSMLSSLAMPLGMMLWGPLGDAVPIDWLLLVTGAFLFLMGFVFLLDKTLRAAGAPISDDPPHAEI